MSMVLNLKNTTEICNLIVEGKVGVLPTDTIYGLVCNASNEQAVDRVYELKSREHKPGTIIAASVDQLVDLGLKRRYLKPVEKFWPNPISIIIPCVFELTYLHQGVGSLAVRVVSDDKLSKLLLRTGPLLTTSANLPGQSEAKNINEAKNYFGDRIDFYVDGGDMHNRKTSTVIRVVDDAIEILREGAVEVTESGIINNKSEN